MAKVLILSRVFPKYHPKAGQPTHFVEQFYNLIYSIFDWSDAPGTALDYLIDLDVDIKTLKHYTIRSGNRFKKGDFFSPRVWSGKPYNSKQIIIAPDTEILKVWDFELDYLGFAYINGKRVNCLIDIALNDGLQPYDFDKWFIPNIKKFKGFKGQIICWSETIKY